MILDHVDAHQMAGMSHPIFVIGRSPYGSWVVREAGGLVGATFANRSEAIRFARLGRGWRPGGILLASYVGAPGGHG
ncbi:RAG2 PHD domain containing protein [Chelatococcus sp. SYSU_G07232]|uniref:RAG2 PHD domain containing protein n=1 Tax=Chelatococcus albus TaxID=3047466 RepID=A0ABT7ALM5_9HYPH|nr:RAG2 PHD domain containing protein [Chelatococcus sp. SYSU_G07232]MDJ1160288.1 RAG2 PHD domain containing protein [Chelatococcus sp. SYSU_G07232]